MRIAYDEMKDVFERVLLKYGFPKKTADLSARLFTDNSCDGIASHGVNRFPRVVSYIKKGHIHPGAEPSLETSQGALERWNGNLGMGNTNASFAMARAMALADESGIGCVALRNTNHWMRGGAYGLQAARAGYIGICWTNTMPNMPPWGAKDRRIGNNPLILAIPHGDMPVLMDGALAQFSYGAIESARIAGRQLPVPGGYDRDGALTTDPASIEETWRVLPIGFWKGSGFSIALDMIGAILSGGNSVPEIGKLGDEISVTQVFIAFKPLDDDFAKTTADAVIADLRAAEPAVEGGEILYPGEKEGRTRKENFKKGIPVVEEIWRAILAELPVS